MLEPSRVLWNPKPQCGHEDKLVMPATAEYVPAGHFSHWSFETRFARPLNLPCEHGLHSSCVFSLPSPQVDIVVQNELVAARSSYVLHPALHIPECAGVNSSIIAFCRGDGPFWDVVMRTHTFVSKLRRKQSFASPFIPGIRYRPPKTIIEDDPVGSVYRTAL